MRILFYGYGYVAMVMFHVDLGTVRVEIFITEI